MKYNGDFQKQITIDQYKGGYLVSSYTLGGREPEIYESFEDAISAIALYFGLTSVGERVVLSSTTEKQEQSEKASR